MLASKVARIGNSVGIVLPKEVTSRLTLDKGEILCLASA